MQLRTRSGTRALAALAIAGAPTFALAQGVPLADEALGQVWGQALINLSNSSANGYDFTRLTLDSTIQLSANLTGLRLGEYTRTPNGTGADIDIPAIHFGRSDLGDDKRTVTITDPYLEFVYKNTGNAATREVVGMRLGFGGISGDVGLQMNSVSGSLLIDTGATGLVDSSKDPNGGVRWDGSCASCAVLLSQITGVTAGDASGASRDFFISVLKQAVQFQGAPGMAAPTTAQSGFWLNWTDRLTALGTSGIIPPNTAKTGP